MSFFKRHTAASAADGEEVVCIIEEILPDELLLEILTHVATNDFNDLVRAAQVCKRWYRIANDLSLLEKDASLPLLTSCSHVPIRTIALPYENLNFDVAPITFYQLCFSDASQALWLQSFASVDEVGLWRMSAEQCCHYRTLHGVVQGRTGMHHWAAEISREQHIGRMNSGAIVLLEEITSITDQVKFECRIVWKLMVNGAGRTKLLIDKSVLRNEVRAAGPLPMPLNLDYRGSLSLSDPVYDLSRWLKNAKEEVAKYKRAISDDGQLMRPVIGRPLQTQRTGPSAALNTAFSAAMLALLAVVLVWVFLY